MEWDFFMFVEELKEYGLIDQVINCCFFVSDFI